MSKIDQANLYQTQILTGGDLIEVDVDSGIVRVLKI